MVSLVPSGSAPGWQALEEDENEWKGKTRTSPLLLPVLSGPPMEIGLPAPSPGREIVGIWGGLGVADQSSQAAGSDALSQDQVPP